MACRWREKKIAALARSRFVIAAANVRQIVVVDASKRINKTFSLKVKLNTSRKVIFKIAPKAIFWWRKAQLIEKIFNKKVIVVELQAEPWGPKLLYESPLEEQEKTMNLERFTANIEFAKKTGLDEFYLWGGEWWYWLKEKQNNPEIWNEAKKLFSQ